MEVLIRDKKQTLRYPDPDQDEIKLIDQMKDKIVLKSCINVMISI